MIELEEVSKEIARLNSNLDGITDVLVFNIEKYQRRYETMLREKSFDISNGKLKSTIKNYNAAQSMSPMRALGFNEIATTHIKEYSGVAKNQLLFNKSINIVPDIGFQDLEILKQARKIDYGVFQSEAHLLDQRIKRELVNAIALETPYQQTISNLSQSLLGAGENLGVLAKFSKTYMNTALFGLTRSIDQEIYSKFGGNEPTALYLYAGPVDSKTSKICLPHIGKVYSRKKAEQLGADNGVTNTFMMGLHFNCRHRWVLITEENAKESGLVVIK